MTLKKRLVSALTAVFMLIISVRGVYASGGKKLIFKYDEKEITVCGNVDEQKAKTVFNSIGNGEVSANRNILCSISHNLAHATIKEVTHRCYATVPRCLEIIYEVTYCTRSDCDYMVWTQIGESRIYCCK
jgi:hypothetical protein